MRLQFCPLFDVSAMTEESGATDVIHGKSGGRVRLDAPMKGNSSS